jgi:hypothetical protein
VKWKKKRDRAREGERWEMEMEERDWGTAEFVYCTALIGLSGLFRTEGREREGNLRDEMRREGRLMREKRRDEGDDDARDEV